MLCSLVYKKRKDLNVKLKFSYYVNKKVNCVILIAKSMLRSLVYKKRKGLNVKLKFWYYINKKKFDSGVIRSDMKILINTLFVYL